MGWQRPAKDRPHTNSGERARATTKCPHRYPPSLWTTHRIELASPAASPHDQALLMGATSSKPTSPDCAHKLSIPEHCKPLRQSGFSDDDVSSKSIMDFADKSLDYVIALNDLTPKELGMLSPARECFVWHFRDRQIEEQRYPGAFSRCLQELNERIRMFLLIVSKHP